MRTNRSDFKKGGSILREWVFFFLLFFLPSCTATFETVSYERRGQLMGQFLAGKAELPCGLACSGRWGIVMEKVRQLHDNQDWGKLALAVLKIGHKGQLPWYYLGRSADGLGKTDAALQYYRTSKSAKKCNSYFINNCTGFEFPRDIDARISIITSKRQIASGSSFAQKASAASNENVCRQALTPRDKPLNWNHGSSFANHIQEVKRRGLTLQRCAELTDRTHQMAGSTRSTASSIESRFSTHSDGYVCGIALTRYAPLNWTSSSFYASGVREAKRRELTVERCAQLTGRIHLLTGSTDNGKSTLSNVYVCRFALTSHGNPIAWNTQRAFSKHVHEAKRRGLTLERCAQLTGRKTQVAKTTAPTERISPPPSPPFQSTPRTAPRHLVMAIQKQLGELGFSPGPADGVVGGKTHAAIKAYQSLANLDVTGEVSVDLLQRLKQEVVSAKPQPAPAVQQLPTVEPPQAALIPSGIDFGRYHALVIGNNAYTALPKLRTAVTDAREVTRTLRRKYGYDVTHLKNATRGGVLSALDELRQKLTENDNLLIYYAGHGWLDLEAERGYWLPVDATRESRANWLSNADITDTLKAMKAKHVMLVADSCYSGTLTRGVMIREAGSSYLSRIAKKRARTVLTSGGLEPVMDSGGGLHSAFAKAFLMALRENTGVMDGTQLFGRVRRLVILNAPQTPEYGDIRFAGHEGGDFLFARRK